MKNIAKKTRRMFLVCMECGHQFKSASMLPECPRCKSSDIELAL